MNLPDRLRIRYKRGQWAVTADQKAFTDWSRKTISMKDAIQILEVDNTCEVTPEMFVANAEFLGYHRTTDFDPEYDVIQDLPYGGELRRFSTVSGVPYSAIYVNGKQVKVIQRKAEQAMLDAWYGLGGNH